MQRRNIVSATIVTMALALVWPQAAQAQRYKRTSLIKEVKVQQTDKTKKLEEKPKKEQRPEITADEFIAIQGKVGNIRKQQVQQYEILINDTSQDDPEMPDLLFRLAELHAQSQRYWHFRGMEMYGKIDKAKTKGEKSSLQRQQNQFFDTSKQELLNAVKVYKRVADNPKFRNYPRMDEALFYYAYTLQGAKYVTEARKVYHRLIKDYPNSKYIPEAYLAFADYYFAENSLKNAETFYDKVLQFPKSSVYNYALYKKGWVYLNLAQHQDALEIFFKVAQRTQNSKKEETLNKASKKDFVRAYAEVGKPQLAYKAFQRVDDGYAFNMLQILGDIYLEQGKANKAIYTFRELMSLKPKHKQVCEWQYNVVHAMLTVGSQDQKVSEIENLVNLYVGYRDKGILPETELNECADNAEAVNNEMAKIWHNEAIKTLNTDTLVYVDRLYRLYLNSFPKSAEYAEVQYYYAELKWSRAENEKNERLATELWEEAAVAFTDVVKSGKLKGKLLKEAAYAAVLGWKNALAVDPRTKAPPETEEESDTLPPPKEIPDREMKMIEAFDVYINYIKDPKDEELVMMKFLKARIFWRHNHFDKAVPLFEDIVQKHLEHETGEYSVNLLLDTLNRAKRYDEMLKWVDILLSKKQFLEGKDDLVQRLETLKGQSMRKNAEKLEQVAKSSGDFTKYVECGKAYLDIYNRNPQGEKNDEVLYNAGVCFEEGKSIGAAITMYNLLSKLYPDSNSTQKAIARLGNNYARVAWYDKSATKLEEYAKRFGGEKDAFQALSDAVFYRKGIGDDEMAVKDTEYFIKQYGSRKIKEAAAAMWSMTAIYEKQGDNEKVISHLRRYLKTYGSKGGVDRQVIAHAKIGMILWSQSCPVRGVDDACIKVQRERSIVNRRRSKKRSSLPTQCGPQSKIKLTVVARDGRKVREAQREFNQAIKLFGNGSAVNKVPEGDGDKGVRAALMVKYFASAKFYLAEEQYEQFLSIKFPTRLDFDERNPSKKKKSLKEFQKWLGDKNKQSSKTAKLYRDIIEVKDAQYAIAAAARIGQVSQNFSDALFTAEIPKDVRTGEYAEDKVDAYCDALTTEAEPLEKLSVDAFGFCLGLSTKLNWFNQWSRLCEKELGQIRPQDFPTASELRAEPNNVAAVTTTEKPIFDLDAAQEP